VKEQGAHLKGKMIIMMMIFTLFFRSGKSFSFISHLYAGFVLDFPHTRRAVIEGKIMKLLSALVTDDDDGGSASSTTFHGRVCLTYTLWLLIRPLSGLPDEILVGADGVGLVMLVAVVSKLCSASSRDLNPRLLAMMRVFIVQLLKRLDRETIAKAMTVIAKWMATPAAAVCDKEEGEEKEENKNDQQQQQRARLALSASAALFLTILLDCFVGAEGEGESRNWLFAFAKASAGAGADSDHVSDDVSLVEALSSCVSTNLSNAHANLSACFTGSASSSATAVRDKDDDDDWQIANGDEDIETIFVGGNRRKEDEDNDDVDNYQDALEARRQFATICVDAAVSAFSSLSASMPLMHISAVKKQEQVTSGGKLEGIADAVTSQGESQSRSVKVKTAMTTTKPVTAISKNQKKKIKARHAHSR
jgi:hypothetical protein